MTAARVDLAKWAGNEAIVPWRLFCLALLLSLLSACSTRGAAPVYNRATQSPPPARITLPAEYYTVSSGDTLYTIAWRYGLDYRILANWNRIRGPAYRIYPGQRLRLKPPPVTRRTVKRPRSPVRQSVPQVTKPPPVIAKVNPKPPSPMRPLHATQTVKLKLNWRWPTKGRVVQTYSSSDPNRHGVRIQGLMGQVVVAAEAGKVVYSGSGLVGYGNLIIIKHNNNYLSAYGYNKKLLVREGDQVARGGPIAEMGAPHNAAEPVLHFEIRKQGSPVNPLPLLPGKQ